MDITKCSGKGCPNKKKCYRYTVKGSRSQSYFVDPPIENGKCELFWGESSENLLNYLKEITTPKRR